MEMLQWLFYKAKHDQVLHDGEVLHYSVGCKNENKIDYFAYITNKKKFINTRAVRVWCEQISSIESLQPDDGHKTVSRKR
jgi:hypothetical protein